MSLGPARHHCGVRTVRLCKAKTEALSLCRFLYLCDCNKVTV